MVNWNHGSGVACFFPFPANNEVSSSTRPLMIFGGKEERKKDIANKTEPSIHLYNVILVPLEMGRGRLLRTTTRSELPCTCIASSFIQPAEPSFICVWYDSIYFSHALSSA